MKDCGAKVLFVEEETLAPILACCKSLDIPKSQVYLMTMEKGPKLGMKTLGDLLCYGEMDWDRFTTHREMRER